MELGQEIHEPVAVAEITRSGQEHDGIVDAPHRRVRKPRVGRRVILRDVVPAEIEVVADVEAPVRHHDALAEDGGLADTVDGGSEDDALGMIEAQQVAGDGADQQGRWLDP